MSDFPIRWDRTKKEQRDQAAAEKAVKELVGRAYEKWKTRLLKKQIHPQKLSQHLNDLRGQVMEILKKSDLKDYTDYTESILDEVAKRVLAWEDTQDPSKPNLFLPDVPNASPVPFHSEEELIEMAVIADHFLAPGFCGLLTKPIDRTEIQLLAAFEDGDKDLKTICLGRLANLKGCGKLPTLREFVYNLAQGRAQRSAAKSTQSSSPAQSSAASEPSSSGDSSKPSAGESGPAGADPAASS